MKDPNLPFWATREVFGVGESSWLYIAIWLIDRQPYGSRYYAIGEKRLKDLLALFGYSKPRTGYAKTLYTDSQGSITVYRENRKWRILVHRRPKF